MANWRKVALSAFLADGKVDAAEVRVLKKELWADGKIDRDEVKFLIELRNVAQKKARAKKESLTTAFENMFFKAVEENVLRNGKISASEAGWLRDMLFADKKIDKHEKKFLTKIKNAATSVSPEFDKLYEECVGSGAAPAKAKPASRKKK